MAYVSDVFNSAMALIGELSSTGAAQTTDTTEYQHRTPAIINTMIAELHILTGDNSSWVPVEGLDDYMSGVSDSFAYGAMHYGLAANLLVDENSSSAGFYQQRYEELRNIFCVRQTGDFEAIEDVYGGIEHGQYARW